MKDDAAIQKDVEEVVEVAKLDRDNVVSDIVARSRQNRDSNDSVEKPISEETVVEKPAPVEKPVQTVEKDSLVPLKINGQTIYKTQQEIDDAGGVAAIQKLIAGDLKLQQAAAETRRLNQRQMDLDERERKLAEREKPVKVSEQDDDDLDMDSIAENIIIGDTKKVAESLRKLAGMKTQPVTQAAPVDADKIANRAAQIAEEKMELRTARNEFARDFADINDNQGLRKMANEHTITLMNEHPDWSPKQILTEAGRRTRADFGLKEPQSSLQHKAQRKAETVDPLPQASTRKVTVQKESQPKTKAQILEEMRASRSR